jgi:cysteine-rich repeat protein
MRKKMYTIGAMLVIAMTTITAADVFLGETISPSVQLSCPAVTIDTNISDGSATYMYYQYKIYDPDNIIRFDSGLTIHDKNWAYFTCNFFSDKTGTWSCTAELIEQNVAWNGSSWVTTGGICDSGTDTENVLPLPICGNSVVEGLEQCDDGNVISEDGCSDQCIAEFCGDGTVQIGLGEQCDSTNNCDSSCQFLPIPINTNFVLYQDNVSEAFILADSYVRKGSPTRNYGSIRRTYTEKGRWGAAVRRSYHELDLTHVLNHPLYTGGNVSRVLYNLTSDGHSNNPDISVTKFVDIWSENTITWANQPCSSDFSGCLGNSFIIPSQLKNPEPNGDFLWTVDITSLVNEAINNGDTTLNLVFKFVDETGYDRYDLEMNSKEYVSDCEKYKGIPHMESWMCRIPASLEVTL